MSPSHDTVLQTNKKAKVRLMGRDDAVRLLGDIHWEQSWSPGHRIHPFLPGSHRNPVPLLNTAQRRFQNTPSLGAPCCVRILVVSGLLVSHPLSRGGSLDFDSLLLSGSWAPCLCFPLGEQHRHAPGTPSPKGPCRSGVVLRGLDGACGGGPCEERLEGRLGTERGTESNHKLRLPCPALFLLRASFGMQGNKPNSL